MRVQLRIAGGGRPSPAAARSGTLDRPQIASLAQRTPHVAAPGDGRPPLRGATVNSEMHQSHARHSAATQLRQPSPQETGPRFQQKCCKRRVAAAKARIRRGYERAPLRAPNRAPAPHLGLPERIKSDGRSRAKPVWALGDWLRLVPVSCEPPRPTPRRRS